MWNARLCWSERASDILLQRAHLRCAASEPRRPYFQNDVLSVFICRRACEACPPRTPCGGGWDVPVGNLAVCLAGSRRCKQMEDRGGFTASWCRWAVGQSHLQGTLQPDPGGADRGAKQRPLAAQGLPETYSGLRIPSQTH